MLNEKTLTIASHFKTFYKFRATHPDIYASLMKRPDDLKALYAMFEDGSIQSYEPMNHRKKDGSLWRKDGGPKEKLPNITREQVRMFAKFYLTHQNFRGNAGKYADASKRLGMYDELEAFFKRRLTVPEIREESNFYPDWETFAIERPKYVLDAECHGVTEALATAMKTRRERGIPVEKRGVSK